MPEFKNFSDFLGKLKKKFNEFFTTYFGSIFIFVLVSYLRILKYRDNLHVQFLYLENLSLKIFLLEKQRLNKLQVFLVYMIGMGVNDDGKCSDGDQTCSLGSEIKYFSNIFFLESNSIKIFRQFVSKFMASKSLIYKYCVVQSTQRSPLILRKRFVIFSNNVEETVNQSPPSLSRFQRCSLS